jgi:hypothetical protein
MKREDRFVKTEIVVWVLGMIGKSVWSNKVAFRMQKSIIISKGMMMHP